MFARHCSATNISFKQSNFLLRFKNLNIYKLEKKQIAETHVNKLLVADGNKSQGP